MHLHDDGNLTSFLRLNSRPPLSDKRQPDLIRSILMATQTPSVSKYIPPLLNQNPDMQLPFSSDVGVWKGMRESFI